MRVRENLKYVTYLRSQLPPSEDFAVLYELLPLTPLFDSWCSEKISAYQDLTPVIQTNKEKQ